MDMLKQKQAQMNKLARMDAMKRKISEKPPVPTGPVTQNQVAMPSPVNSMAQKAPTRIAIPIRQLGNPAQGAGMAPSPQDPTGRMAPPAGALAQKESAPGSQQGTGGELSPMDKIMQQRMMTQNMQNKAPVRPGIPQANAMRQGVTQTQEQMRRLAGKY